MQSKVIIMLTNNDKTVKEAYETFEACKDLPIDYWGFKDVGLEKSKMKELVGAMKAAGKTTFLEVVSYTEEACMEGAKTAVSMGFDHLMGTIYHKSVFDYLKQQPIKFLPFCGKVYGSPSVLEGTFDEIIADANGLLDEGVYGIDLLAFRHKQGEALARAYCEAIRKPVVIAGSINSPERIDFVDEIKPWAFTMGTALFNKNFRPGESFRKNLEFVVDYMEKIK